MASPEHHGSKNARADRICVQDIRYKWDKENPGRLIRPRIKYILPSGETLCEPSYEKTGIVEVKMEPEIQGRVWMSSLPINFTSPCGLVVPLGQSGAQHIQIWTPGHEPRQVMQPPAQHLPAQPLPAQHPLALDPSVQYLQGEAFSDQVFPVQPLPGYPLQGYPVPGQLPHAQLLPDQYFLQPQRPQFSAEGPPQQPHSTNDQQCPQGTVSEPITPESLSSDSPADKASGRLIGHQPIMMPEQLAAHQQGGELPISPQGQQFLNQQVGEVSFPIPDLPAGHQQAQGPEEFQQVQPDQLSFQDQFDLHFSRRAGINGAPDYLDPPIGDRQHPTIWYPPGANN